MGAVSIFSFEGHTLSRYTLSNLVARETLHGATIPLREAGS